MEIHVLLCTHYELSEPHRCSRVGLLQVLLKGCPSFYFSSWLGDYDLTTISLMSPDQSFKYSANPSFFFKQIIKTQKIRPVFAPVSRIIICTYNNCNYQVLLCAHLTLYLLNALMRWKAFLAESGKIKVSWFIGWQTTIKLWRAYL